MRVAPPGSPALFSGRMVHEAASGTVVFRTLPIVIGVTFTLNPNSCRLITAALGVHPHKIPGNWQILPQGADAFGDVYRPDVCRVECDQRSDSIRKIARGIVPAGLRSRIFQRGLHGDG